MKASWLLILFAGLNSTTGDILLKKAQLKHIFIKSLSSIEFLFGDIFYLFNVLLFAYALKNLEVIKAYPVLSRFAFLNLSVFSFISLEEKLDMINYFGMFLILFGIILVLSK